ncbi:GMC oxidoreductase [Steroidobacter sp.]|uniref:GMC oxidoreductase n=1 Tax=Steroidobacter sp. TaxID=1978227 RepID=UPI001A471F2C|nr:GMC family oxidoreductase [Steroidobacter sp.]MBL8264969.1 GMC family oxidoreductase [Steroidobacter sp.]
MSYDFDAIVIGSGVSGGWAAKELTEKGLKTLVVERGRNVRHRIDYPTESTPPWAIPFNARIPQAERDRDYPTQIRGQLSQYNKHFYVKDSERPYVQEKPFVWIRGDQVGGKSLLWARQVYRWSDLDFSANAKDGHGTDWPLRYRDIAPWYDHVERFAGVAGNRDGIAHLPDGVFQPAFGLTDPELFIKSKVEAAFPGRYIINARVANLTQPTEEQLQLGRAPCQARNQCNRGCSFGAYFSSQSSTLPAAERTGNLTLLPDTVVHSLVHDPISKRVSAVRLIDTRTKASREVRARIVFVCASTLASTQLLLNSMDEIFPNGIGNSSGVLGRYLMDHVWGGGASGTVPGFEQSFYRGRRPGAVYVPRFRNVESTDALPFLRGYGYQGGSSRGSWGSVGAKAGIGESFKAQLGRPGGWGFSIGGIGEMLPRYENHVSLDPRQRDEFGVPLLRVSCEYSDNERAMVRDMAKAAGEMLRAAGLTDVKEDAEDDTPGVVIHEVGTARMGLDPRTSYLNAFSQSHDVPNLFVTDGAAFASSSCVNPSLTFMALTARAADYAVTQIKAGRL